MVRTWKYAALGASALWLGVAGCSDQGGNKERRAGASTPAASGPQATSQRDAAPGAQAGGQASAQASTVTGEVKSAKKDELVLKQEGQDKDLKLKVDESTQVMIDGQRASIEQLREGTQVRASMDASNKATRIEATGQGASSGQGSMSGSAPRGSGDQPGGSAGTTGGLGGASSHTPGQTGGPGGDKATSASEPGAPTGSGTTGSQPGAK